MVDDFPSKLPEIWRDSAEVSAQVIHGRIRAGTCLGLSWCFFLLGFKHGWIIFHFIYGIIRIQYPYNTGWCFGT